MAPARRRHPRDGGGGALSERRVAGSWLEQLRSSAWLAYALSLAWLLYALASLTAGRHTLAAIQALAMVPPLVVHLAVRGRAHEARLRAHGLAGVTLLTLAALAVMTGQASSPAGWYLPMLGLFAAQVDGWRGFLVWTGLGAAGYGAVTLSERFVRVPSLATYSETEVVLSSMGVTALVLVYAAASTRAAHTRISEQEAREDRIAAQAEELRVMRDELAASHRLAVAAAESKSRLMARVSHELRTPLNGLIGLTEILAESRLPAAQLEIVRTLRASARTLLQLVNDLLDVTRLEEGELPVRAEPTRLRELIGDVMDTFANVAEGKGLGFAAVVDAEVPDLIEVDALRVRQIVSNLVNNALKFTERGEVVLRVRGELHADRFRARIDVTDTGPGIAKSKLSGLFRAYEQLDDPLPLRRQGTGLGLWIAREIAEMLGASLEVSSAPDEGSTFSLFLEAPAGSPGKLRESGIAMVGLSVLAVEPHEASREALRQLARFEGFEVQTYASIEELPADAEADVVVLDLESHQADLESARRTLSRRQPSARLVLGAPPSHVADAAPGFSASTLKPYRASRLRAVLFDVLPDESALGPTAMPRRLRVLVVDDDPTNRMVARLFLERAGQDVVLAGTAQEAWSALSSGDVDVAFVDLHLPDESGLSLASHVRSELDPDRRLWLIALTAAATEEDRRRCFEAGMDDFVAKPIQLGLFRAALERAHRMSRRRRRSSSHGLAASAAPIDLPTFRALGEVLEADLGPLVEEYLENGRALLRDLHASLADPDPTSAHRAAHTLASSSAMIGAAEASRLSRAMEGALKAGEPLAEEDVRALERAFGAVERSLRALSPRGGSDDGDEDHPDQIG